MARRLRTSMSPRLRTPTPPARSTWRTRRLRSAEPAPASAPACRAIFSGGISRLISRASTSIEIVIALFDRRDRSAVGGFGRHVRNHESVRGAAETAVGHQRDGFRQARADNGAGDAQHLAHARSAARPFVANHDHVVRPDLAARHRGHGVFLAVEHARRTAVLLLVVSGQLDHAAFGRERSAQNGQAAGRLERLVERPDHFLARAFPSPPPPLRAKVRPVQVSAEPST